MATPSSDLLARVQYLTLRLLASGMHSWPVGVNLDVAERLGQIAYRFDTRHRARIRANLTRSLPHLSDVAVDRYGAESFGQLFKLAVEVLFTTRLIRPETFRRHVVLGDFRETLRLLTETGPDGRRGLILLTGHYGNWEVLGYVLATLGFPTLSVARPLDNPYINDWLLGVRQRRGQTIIDKRGATTPITDALDRHGAVGFIADQNAGPKGMFVDFFGRPASTYKSIGLLAMRYEVPIVVGYARRVRGKAFVFEVGTSDIIYPEDWADESDPLRYITQRYTHGIETFVREDPGQYLWVHRRWKTRPKGEPPGEYD